MFNRLEPSQIMLVRAGVKNSFRQPSRCLDGEIVFLGQATSDAEERIAPFSLKSAGLQRHLSRCAGPTHSPPLPPLLRPLPLQPLTSLSGVEAAVQPDSSMPPYLHTWSCLAAQEQRLSGAPADVAKSGCVSLAELRRWTPTSPPPPSAPVKSAVSLECCTSWRSGRSQLSSRRFLQVWEKCCADLFCVYLVCK